MTTCHRSFLEFRCRERGYTLDEVMPCVVAQDGDQWTIDISHSAYPKTPKPAAAQMPDLSRDQADAPGFLTKVKNFAVAAAGHVAAGLPMCSDDEIIRRHNICLTCEFLTDNACSQCGCPVSRTFGYVSKLSWADQECPVGKWGQGDSKRKNRD
jgi:hypothetical protein